MPEKIRFDLLVKKNFLSFVGEKNNFSPEELKKIKTLSRVFWQDQIKSGFIQVKKGLPSKPGMKIELEKSNPPFFHWKKIRKDFYANFCPQVLPFPASLDLVCDWPDFVAVNKPAGMNVYTPYPVPRKPPRTVSLLDVVCSRFPAIRFLGAERPGLVHRLDKETSGVLIIAKNKNFQSFLRRKFFKREVQKTYLSLVPNKFPFSDFLIKSFIGKNQKNPLIQKTGEYHFLEGKIGNQKKYWEKYLRDSQSKNNQNHLGIIKPKPSLTLGKVLSQGTFSEMMAGLKNQDDLRGILKTWKEIFFSVYGDYKKNQPFSFLEITPVSGRTHQIRVHLSKAGFPVVGDKTYGSQFFQIPSCHFLHAYRIFWKSKKGEKSEIKAKVVNLMNHR